VKNLTAPELPAPYRQDAPCPKCASATATTELCRKSTDVTMPSVFCLVSTVSLCWEAAGHWEHLHRVCMICGHEWFQRPIDAPAGEFTAERIQARADALRGELESEQRQREESREKSRQGLAKPAPVSRRWWQR
jgi:hypothetical protein